MATTTATTNNTAMDQQHKRDPLQSPVFKMRGLEMTVYGLEKENLDLRQTIEQKDKEINNLKNTMQEYELENERHERRHAQLEEEIIELRQQLKQNGITPNITTTYTSSTPKVSGVGVDINSLRLNNSNGDGGVGASGSGVRHDKYYEDSSLYLYTGRSIPSNNSPSLSKASSFNLNSSGGISNPPPISMTMSSSSSSNNVANVSSSTLLDPNNNNNLINHNNNHNHINNNNNNNNNISNVNNNNIGNNDNQASSSSASSSMYPTHHTPTLTHTRSPFQKAKPPSSPTIVSCVTTEGGNAGVNISMTPSPVIAQPRKKSIISLFSL
ncbi:hypothetical protein SAMD00019534_035310, partial [Acytostelium subglobosum LB1]|uniref:hypothetical protein n=1 Tax=Acytostelium subglobosum LB1 TaxID=1410327 RepID=UPI0006451082